MKTRVILLAILVSSCDLFDKEVLTDEKIGGETNAIGKVGNSFSSGGSLGMPAFSAVVKSVDDGVSNISGTMTVTDSKLTDLAKTNKDFKISGNTVTVSKNFRITEKGIQNVLEDGYFTLIEYDGKVGDKYSHKIDGKKVTREITYKSTDNDYEWGFLDIKVMKVTETGRSLPGVKKLEYIFNHNFGLVGAKAYFDDGTEKIISIFSKN